MVNVRFTGMSVKDSKDTGEYYVVKFEVSTKEMDVAKKLIDDVPEALRSELDYPVEDDSAQTKLSTNEDDDDE